MVCVCVVGGWDGGGGGKCSTAAAAASTTAALQQWRWRQQVLADAWSRAARQRCPQRRAAAAAPTSETPAALSACASSAAGLVRSAATCATSASSSSCLRGWQGRDQGGLGCGRDGSGGEAADPRSTRRRPGWHHAGGGQLPLASHPSSSNLPRETDTMRQPPARSIACSRCAPVTPLAPETSATQPPCSEAIV